MGYLCNGNKPKYENLAELLTKEINGITTDETEKDKIYRYVNRITRVARNYLLLDS